MTMLTSALGADPVQLEALYRANRARVFSAFTEPEKFARWFGREGGTLRVEIDARIGGAWRAVFFEGPQGSDCVEGVYTELDPVSRLAFTWRQVRVAPAGARSESPLSKVTVTLEEEGAATRLRLRHEGVSEGARRNVGPGWQVSLEKLKAELEADL